jgi:hypothetical protein
VPAGDDTGASSYVPNSMAEKMNQAKFIILLAFVVEVGMLTFLRGKFGAFVSPLILFLASLFIGIYPIVLAYKRRIAGENPVARLSALKRTLPILIAVLGITITAIFVSRIFQDYEINAERSDIIPCIDVMVSRFLNGAFPYKTVSEWGYDIYPNYLPLTWMPFILAKLLNIDFRWLAFAVLCLGILLYVLVLLTKNMSLANCIFLSALPFAVLLTFMIFEPAIFGHSIETLIVGYYLILSLSIFSESVFYRAIGVTLCLLSRYSLIVWVPLYLIVVFFLEKRKNALYISAFALLAILIIYCVPFLSRDLYIFQRGSNYYNICAIGEWNARPFHLFRGVGFACYFYNFLKGPLLDRLRLLQSTHIILSFLSVLIPGLLYIKLKKHVHYKLYLLCSLKIYFAFFYNFIQVPYMYLFLVPVVVSLVIVLEVFGLSRSSRQLEGSKIQTSLSNMK